VEEDEKRQVTILEEDPAIHPHTHLCPMIYIGSGKQNGLSPSTQRQEVVGMTMK
jgi:hypothetical protein